MKLALRRRARRARDDPRPSACCPTTSSIAWPNGCSGSSHAHAGRRVHGQPREQAGRGGVRLQHARPRVLRRDRFAVPGQQVEPFAVAGACLDVACVVGGDRVQRAIVVQPVEGEQPLQVDRVVLRREVEQVAEALERVLPAVRPIAGSRPPCRSVRRAPPARRSAVPRRSRSASGSGCCPLYSPSACAEAARVSPTRGTGAPGRARSSTWSAGRAASRAACPRPAPRRPCMGGSCSTRVRPRARPSRLLRRTSARGRRRSASAWMPVAR